MNLYPYVKQHKLKRDSREAFYAIHSRWLGPNQVNTMALEAEMALQTSTFDREKRAWNWEKYVACHVKYHIIIGNLIKYGYQGLDKESKVWYQLNYIRCDKLFTAIATVRAHPDKNEKDFDKGHAALDSGRPSSHHRKGKQWLLYHQTVTMASCCSYIKGMHKYRHQCIMCH